MGVLQKIKATAQVWAPKSAYQSGAGSSPVGPYMPAGGGNSALSWFSSWLPVLRDAGQDTQAAYVGVTARVIDALHNTGWLAGAVEQARVQMVGTGLSLNSKPDPTLFGTGSTGRQLAAAWAKEVEARFNAYANNPWSVDLGGRYTLGQLEAQAVNQYFATGEILSTLPYRLRPGNQHGLKVNLMPSIRLSQGTWGPNASAGRQGVIMDADGAPAAYCIENWNNLGGDVQQQIVQARDADGNPMVLHLFDNAPGAVRGISPLAPALKVVRQFDQTMDATLTTMMIHTIFSATIESESPTEEILKAVQTTAEQDDYNPDMEGAPAGAFNNFMATRFGWYEKTNIDLGQRGKLTHLFPGEKLNLNRSTFPNTNFDPMVKMMQREICRCLGVTYEQGTLDYMGATYSSVRMSGADVWLINMFRRAFGPARLKHEVYRRWLEEEILTGQTIVPGGVSNYILNKERFERAEYRGPPRPSPDDLKTAKANQIAQLMGWTTGTAISADYGTDQFANYDQLQAEKEARDEAGLGDLPPLGGGGQAPAPDEPNGTEPPAPLSRMSALVKAVQLGDSFVALQLASELSDYLEGVE